MSDPLLDLVGAGQPPQATQPNQDSLLALVNPQGIPLNGKHPADPLSQTSPLIPTQSSFSNQDSSASNGISIGSPSDFSAAVIHHAMNPIHGAAQLIEHGIQAAANTSGNNAVTRYINNVVAQDDAAIHNRESSYQSTTPDNVASYGGAALGEVAPFAINGVAKGVQGMGNVAANAVSNSAPWMPKIIPQMIGGAAQGDLIAQAQPVTGNGDYWTNKHTQEKYGAVGGALGPIGLGAVASMVSPNPSAAYTNLADSGVNTTIGQRLGGILNSMEEKAQSLPIVGDMIAKARGNALKSWNLATLNKVVDPVGGQVTNIGHEGVSQAGDLIGNAYNTAKNQLGGFQIDSQGQQGFTALQNGVGNATNLTGQGKSVFNNLLGLVKQQISPNGSILPQGFKEIDSKLTQEAARYSGSTDAYQQNLGDAIKQLQSVLLDNAKRANPQAAAQMDAADEAWAKLVRVEGAAKTAASNKSNTGVFTPSQLMQSVRSNDQSVRDRATARGQALMQDWAQNGMQVLGDKVPNSGTFDRAANGALIAALYAHPSAAIPAAAGIGAGSLLYTQPGQKLAVGALTSRPQYAPAVANFLRNYIPTLTP